MTLELAANISKLTAVTLELTANISKLTAVTLELAAEISELAAVTLELTANISKLAAVTLELAAALTYLAAVLTFLAYFHKYLLTFNLNIATLTLIQQTIKTKHTAHNPQFAPAWLTSKAFAKIQGRLLFHFANANKHLSLL